MTPRSYDSLPGPRAAPLVGSIFEALRSPLVFFESLKREHGDAVRFKNFSARFILFSHPAQVNEILMTRHSSFCKGRALAGARTFLGDDSLLLSEGGDYTRRRRLIQPAFHRTRIAGYAQVMANKAKAWVDAQQADKPLDLYTEMNALTLGIVSDTLFGSEAKSRAQEIGEAMTVVIHNFTRMLAPLWTMFYRLPTEQNRKLWAAGKKLNETIYQIISERCQDGRDRGDLLSMLLAAEDAENPQQRLTDTEVRDQAATLFLAGYETTANATTWTWHLLTQHEAVRAKMKAEIDAILGPDRLPGLEDTTRLPYTTAVFSEAMRLYPPVWVVGRRALEDVIIGDCLVPRDTIVLMSQYLIHRDERFWPDPTEFRPERWLDEAAQAERLKLAYFPFGGGRHVCIGEAFSWTEGVIMLAVIARRWRFEAAPDQVVDVNPGITLNPKYGLKVITRAA